MSDEIGKKIERQAEARERLLQQLNEAAENLNAIHMQIEQLKSASPAKSLSDEQPVKLMPEQLTVEEIISRTNESDSDES